jgi:hypothetical protein
MCRRGGAGDSLTASWDPFPFSCLGKTWSLPGLIFLPSLSVSPLFSAWAEQSLCVSVKEQGQVVWYGEHSSLEEEGWEEWWKG